MYATKSQLQTSEYKFKSIKISGGKVGKVYVGKDGRDEEEVPRACAKNINDKEMTHWKISGNRSFITDKIRSGI